MGRACQRLMDAVNMPTKTFSTAMRFSASASLRCLSPTGDATSKASWRHG